jgi:DNA-binding transcriptional ArsR family regulator
VDAWEALGDPSRRQLVRRLSRGSCPAGELAAGFAVSRPAVSRHLRVLREAGLVESERRGQQQIYSLRTEALDEVATWIGQVRQFWQQRLDALETEIARGKRARRMPKETR